MFPQILLESYQSPHLPLPEGREDPGEWGSAVESQMN